MFARAVFIASCLFLTQCSIRSMAIREVSEIVSAGVPAFEQDDDPELIREALPGNIKLLEAMLISDPQNQQLMTLLAQMYASYTFGFIEAELEKPNVPQKNALKERINRLYLRGISYGEKALIQSEPSCEKGLKSAAQLDDCLNKLDRTDVPALFWYGFNIAAYLNRNLNSVSALAKGVNIEKSMARIIALDEGFMHGSAHLFLMAYFGSRPPMMGGSFEKAENHYQRIKKISHNQFRLADVFYARYVLVQKDDKAAFEKLLQSVVDSNSELDKNANLRLYNTLAKTRAKLYLNNTDEFF